LSYSALKLCSGRSAFEAIPEPPQVVDLARVRERLSATGVEVTDARVMLIARTTPESTISRDGRLLIKTSDPEEARRVFERLQPLLEGATSEGAARPRWNP
jgi:hypothetical protein